MSGEISLADLAEEVGDYAQQWGECEGAGRFQLAVRHPRFQAQLDALLTMTADEEEAELPFPERPAWKMLRLGTYSTIEELRAVLMADGRFRVSKSAKDLLNQETFPIVLEGVTVELVIPMVWELINREVVDTDQVYEAAFKAGYRLCPPEVAPQLMLQCAERLGSRNLPIVIATQAITGHRRDFPKLFRVSRIWGDLELGSVACLPDSSWDSHTHFAFVRS